MPRITTAQMEDFAGLMRRLWKGETIIGHDGPAGSWPVLRLDPDFDEDIPLALVAFGRELPRPRRPRLRRRDPPHLLHRRDARALRRHREARRRGGRPRPRPSVRVWSCFATVGDHIPEPLRLKKTVGRLGSYLQGYGDLHGRDERLGSRRSWPRSAPTRVVATLPGFDRPDRHHRAARAHRHVDPRRVARPRRHRHPRAVRGRGARASSTSAPTRVILHGATPTELAPVVEAYAAG